MLKQRLHFIDNLRAINMLLILLLHVLVSFTTKGFYPWPVLDKVQSPVFNIIIISMHIFTMPLFFLIAGYIACLLHKQLGTLQFIRQRFIRIAIPFLLGMIFLFYIHTIEALTFIVNSCHLGLANCFGEEGFLAIKQLFFSAKTSQFLHEFYDSTGNLWFLYYLLIFYVIVILLQSIYRVFSKFINEWPINFYAFKNFKSIACYIILILISILSAFKISSWFLVPPLSFVPNIYVLLFYGLFFLYGWFNFPNLKMFTPKQVFLISIVLIILLPLYVYLIHYQNSLIFIVQNQLLHFIVAIILALCTWLVVLSIVTLFFYKLNKPKSYLRYLANASYWIYLMQLPIIIYLQGYFAQNSLPVISKILIIFTLVLVFLLWTYQFLVRTTFLKRFFWSKA